MEKVTIEITPEWIKRINSPLGKIAQALSGVSVSFAPLFLYWYGESGCKLSPVSLVPAWIGIPVCVVMILLPGSLYIKLGQLVIDELNKNVKKI